MFEAFVGGITEAVLGYLLSQMRLPTSMRVLLNMEPSPLAFQVALAEAFEALGEAYPYWQHFSLFDQHFLTHGAAPLLARCLIRDNPPTGEELAQAWSAQLGGVSEPVRAARLAEVRPVADFFLAAFERALRAKAPFQALFDSRAHDATAAATQQIAKSNEQIYEEMTRLRADLVRLLEQERASPLPPLAREPGPFIAGGQRTHILLVSACPRGTNHVRFQTEEQQIRSRLPASHFVADPMRATRLQEFHQQMLDRPPHIWHFIGHASSAGELIFEDEYRHQEVLRLDDLRDFFDLLKNRLRLRGVFLNACYTLETARCLLPYVPHVIGWAEALDDEVALQVATTFYQTLPKTSWVEAFKIARLSIKDRAVRQTLHLLTWPTAPRLLPTAPVQWHPLPPLPQGISAAQAVQVEAIQNPDLPLDVRLQAAQQLAALGDPRRGVGLNEAGWPDIDWVPIPATSDPALGPTEAALGTFWIARYPITRTQFAAFVADREGYHTRRWWQGRSPVPPASRPAGAGHLPCTQVNWYEAQAFCQWLGDRLNLVIQLPSQAQWKKAACGPQGTRYPWGDDYQPGHANFLADGPGALTPVGLYPAGYSPYGVLDMYGNVWEWSGTRTADGICCILCGGSWKEPSGDTQAQVYLPDHPENRDGLTGFRPISLSAPPDAG